jgi:hypothetical protein
MKSAITIVRAYALSFFLLPLTAHGFALFPAKRTVHGPHNRQYWRDGYDIHTDYTNHSVPPPPNGKLVEVHQTLFRTQCSEN